MNPSWTTSNYYVWTDGDGTEHYFKASGSQPYKDEETKTLKLSVSGSTATIRSKDDTAMLFPLPANETKTCITRVTDACGNQANYSYGADGKLSKITDGAGRETTFTYSGGLLVKIQADVYKRQLLRPSTPTPTVPTAAITTRCPPTTATCSPAA